jgi:hypothetical protein
MQIDGIDPIGLYRQAQVGTREEVQFNEDIHPVDAHPLGRSGKIVMKPGDKGYQQKLARMCRPDPLPGEEKDIAAHRGSGLVTMSGQPIPSGGNGAVGEMRIVSMESEPRKRLVINYGRLDGEFMVVVEESPDWETVGAPKKMTRKALEETMPVFRNLGIKIKNNTEEDFDTPQTGGRRGRKVVGKGTGRKAQDPGVSGPGD